MANFKWLLAFVGMKKKSKVDKESLRAVDSRNGTRTLRVKIECSEKSPVADELRSSSFRVSVPFGVPNSSSCEVKLLDHENPVEARVKEAAYEGGDEHDEVLSMKRGNSDFDLQAHVGDSNVEHDHLDEKGRDLLPLIDTKTREKDVEECLDITPTGHVSDPGIGKADFWASPKLQRSCSNLETRTVIKKLPPKAQSFEELQRLTEMVKEEVLPSDPGSPVSAFSHGSADKVMLKKHSSSQILPSRSRKLWWRLFLWSHRNLQGPWSANSVPLPTKPAINQQGGYCSDTLEASRGAGLGNLGSPASFTKESPVARNNHCHQNWGTFSGGASGLWLQNQWVAFSAESSAFTRVDEWVKDIPTEPPFPANDEHRNDDGIFFPPSPETSGSLARSTTHLTMHPNVNLPQEIQYANNIIQSLNSSSTVAHIAGIGLKAIPIISCFASLRSVNLSGNLIVHITPGSLPRGLQTLNLSKNKINTIEGLRDLTRLRVLDLSYNRISRIGQGLSNCTLIKELYLAGNKISDVEGLHRLLKLTILDLSFNKITTTKELGQLVANYNSLLALNLLANPVQTNISDDQLRKAVCSLLTKLAYLNRQPINQHRARELHTEAIAKAAFGNSGWNARRKSIKRVVNQSGSSHSSGHTSGGSLAQQRRHRSRSRTQQQSGRKGKTLVVATSYH